MVELGKYMSIRDFNSLAPRGANHVTAEYNDRFGDFNSLAPRGANHVGADGVQRGNDKFQLTRPAWGEPRALERIQFDSPISTHSPRVGRTRKDGFGGV